MKKKIFTNLTKMFIVTAFFVFIGQSGWAADRYSVANGVWASTATWSDASGGLFGASIPVAGDNVFVEGGYTVTMGAAAAATNVTVRTVSILDATTFALAVSGTFTLEDGSTFKQGGAVNSVPGTIAKVFAPTSTYIYNGIQAGLSGTFPTYGNLIFQPSPTGAGSFAGNLDVAGDMTINLGTVFEIRFATGGTGRTDNIAGNLTVSGSGIVVGNNGTAASSVTIGGNLNVAAGTFRGNNSTGNITFNIAGNITNNGTWQQDDGSAAGIFAVVCNGLSSSQTIGGTNAIALENFTISNSNGVIIDNTVNTTGAVVVNSNAALTINASKSMDVSGSLLLSSDNTGTGSFIDNGTISGTGTFTVQKYLTGAGGPTPIGRFWYIGTPVPSITSTAFTASGDNRLWFHSEGPVTQGYAEITTDGVALNALQGYVARLGATETINFIGTSLNTGIFGTSTNLTRSALGAFDGYNLVSNPYPSAINWGEAASPTTGLTQTNLETTIWYRTSGAFATYNWQGGSGVNGGQQYVPAMQAFWVRVKSGFPTGGLELANTTRAHNAQAFYKTASESNFFRMNVSDGINTDETAVGFYANALNTYEDYDSEKMFYTDEDVPQVYTLTSDATIAAINGQTELILNEERIVPLGFSTPVAGTFTFSATNLNEFDAAINVYLEDVQEGITTDLRQTSTYQFGSAAINNAARFNIHFVNGLTTGITETASNTITIYSADNSVYINNQSANTASIEVYDMLGKLLVSQNAEKGLNTLKLNIENGVYLVKAINGNQIVSKKVFISK